MRLSEDLGWPVSAVMASYEGLGGPVSASHHNLCSPRCDDSSMTCAHHEPCSPRVAGHLRSLTKRMPPMLTKRMPSSSGR